MTSTDGTGRSVTLPAVALAAIRRAIAAGSGPLASIQSLQAAGFETGGTLYETLAATVRSDTSDLPQEDFWKALSNYFTSSGWGTLRHSTPHPGVGLLSSGDWIEGEGAEADSDGQPAGSFSSGVLSGLLSRAASEPVAVLQVACRARGDQECQFAFGSEETIQTLYSLLLEQPELGSALERL